jgi:hypothetical protein
MNERLVARGTARTVRREGRTASAACGGCDVNSSRTGRRTSMPGSNCANRFGTTFERQGGSF